MADPEYVEKVRQEIMRFRELLNITRLKLEEGERAYEKLFSNCSPEDVKRVKHKDLQKMVALELVDNLKPLSVAVMQMRYDLQGMERAFEELYNIIVTPPSEDDEAQAPPDSLDGKQ